MIQHQNINPNQYQQLYQSQLQQMQQQAQQMQQQIPQIQPQYRGGRIWVTGEAGAKAYLVAPNASVDLWDSETHTIYVKSADASGMPTMQILEYTIKGANNQNEPQEMQQPVYVSVEEFNVLKDELNALKEQFKHTSQRKPNNQKKGGNL